MCLPFFFFSPLTGWLARFSCLFICLSWPQLYCGRPLCATAHGSYAVVCGESTEKISGLSIVSKLMRWRPFFTRKIRKRIQNINNLNLTVIKEGHRFDKVVFFSLPGVAICTKTGFQLLEKNPPMMKAFLCDHIYTADSNIKKFHTHTNLHRMFFFFFPPWMMIQLHLFWIYYHFILLYKQEKSQKRDDHL